MEPHDSHNVSMEATSIELVCCLSIDLIDSTETGLNLTTQRLDRFNQSLVSQIKPHLEHLGLADVLIKFTGDGWLVVTEKTKKVPSLCCLATIMAHTFQEEMNRQTGIPIDKIPPLRLAICGGRDMCVELPDGRKDWVGDSNRRAVRVSDLCSPNEILIDELVRYVIQRDFDLNRVDVEERVREHQSRKMEEHLTLYELGELRVEAAADSEAPEYFVYTLDTIGRSGEANTVVQHVSKQWEEKAQRILRSWNRLMNSISDYSIVLTILESIQRAGLSPDVFTYNILINKAPDYDTAERMVKEMQEHNIEPDVVTYSTLISKAPEEALLYFETAYAHKPQHPGMTLALGLAFARLGRKGEAIQYLEKALEMTSEGKTRTTIKKIIRKLNKNSQKNHN